MADEWSEGKRLSQKSLAESMRPICSRDAIPSCSPISVAVKIEVLAPNQRPVIAKLGLKALAAGSLSNLMSAALAGLFLSLG